VLAGAVELREQFPELHDNEETTRVQFLGSLLRRPHLTPCFIVYLMIKRAIRKQFHAKQRAGTVKAWDRDDSSRAGS